MGLGFLPTMTLDSRYPTFRLLMRKRLQDGKSLSRSPALVCPPPNALPAWGRALRTLALIPLPGCLLQACKAGLLNLSTTDMGGTGHPLLWGARPVTVGCPVESLGSTPHM